MGPGAPADTQYSYQSLLTMSDDARRNHTIHERDAQQEESVGEMAVVDSDYNLAMQRYQQREVPSELERPSLQKQKRKKASRRKSPSPLQAAEVDYMPPQRASKAKRNAQVGKSVMSLPIGLPTNSVHRRNRNATIDQAMSDYASDMVHTTRRAR